MDALLHHLSACHDFLVIDLTPPAEVYPENVRKGSILRTFYRRFVFSIRKDKSMTLDQISALVSEQINLAITSIVPKEIF